MDYDDMFKEAMEDVANEERLKNEHNRKLIDSLGKTAWKHFGYLISDTEWVGRIEIVSEPQGILQEDNNKYFKSIHVSQKVGYLGDDFYGDIYVSTKLGWLKIPYSC